MHYELKLDENGNKIDLINNAEILLKIYNKN